MFAAQTRLRSILSGRFTFKFGSFNWIRFMITSYVLLHIVLTIQKKSLVIMRKTKKENSLMWNALYRIYPHKSDTRVHYPILYGLLLGGIIKPKRIFYLDSIHNNSDFSPIPVIRTICMARVIAT